MEHRPMFFEKWDNPFDNQVYYVYNGKYFEHNRPNQDWKKCPDIFGYNEPTPD